MRYVVTIEEQILELEVEPDSAGGYRVRGAGGPELRVQTLANRAGLVSVLVEGRTLEVQASECAVHYNRERFVVRAESGLQRAAIPANAGSGAQSKKVLASMPGRIVRVSCEPGSVVHEGTPLIVIEAMKMQNELCAKASAIVGQVRVSVGQTVERGALLIEFE